MIRKLSTSLLTLGMASLCAYGADVVTAPPPREARTDGSTEPVPEATPKAQNPLETVERIINNSKAVGDKLAQSDTGKDTQQTQDTILKDIRSLIEREENPPPKPDQKSNDMNEDKQPNGSPNDKDKNQQPKHPDGKDKQEGPMPKSEMNNMPPKGGMNRPPKEDMPPNGGKEPSPMEPSPMEPSPMGDPDQPRERRPRQQAGNKTKEQGKSQESTSGASGSAKTSQGAGQGASADPRGGGGGGMGRAAGSPQTPTSPTLPPELIPMKDVWGYLPDKMRQQAMQYYKQEFVPRYAKLLEYYYSSLAEKKKP